MCSQSNRILKDESALNALYDTLEAELIHGPVEVSFGPYKPQRSVLQNRLYWSILTSLEKETGNDKEDLHIFFKIKFLGATPKEILGQSMLVSNSTSKLNVKEFSDLLTRLIDFCFINGYPLNLPENMEDILVSKDR